MSYDLHLLEWFKNFVVLDCIFIIYLITFHGFFSTFYNYLFIFNINIFLIQSFENYNVKLYKFYCQGCSSHVMYTHTTT